MKTNIEQLRAMVRQLFSFAGVDSVQVSVYSQEVSKFLTLLDYYPNDNKARVHINECVLRQLEPAGVAMIIAHEVGHILAHRERGEECRGPEVELYCDAIGRQLAVQCGYKVDKPSVEELFTLLHSHARKHNPNSILLETDMYPSLRDRYHRAIRSVL